MCTLLITSYSEHNTVVFTVCNSEIIIIFRIRQMISICWALSFVNITSRMFFNSFFEHSSPLSNTNLQATLTREGLYLTDGNMFNKRVEEHLRCYEQKWGLCIFWYLAKSGFGLTQHKRSVNIVGIPWN